MGNKIGKRRQVVDEKYTKPQGLYQHRDIDNKKLRKLILESKLAPCYPGLDDCSFNLEECPICFLHYPSLNRSRCCMKGICTECFLQMKPPHSARPTQCPFCKTSNYAVEYRGAKTKEEKGAEQVEEQKVLEAQIRVRQQELQDETERMKRQEISSSSTPITPIDVGYVDTNNVFASEEPLKSLRQLNDLTSHQASSSAPTTARIRHPRYNRDDNFDLDLEDIMVMEAIWLSIQEQRSKGHAGTTGGSMPSSSALGERYKFPEIAPVKLPHSGGLAGGLASAAAALAERQHMVSESAGRNAAASANAKCDTLGECSTDCWSQAADSGTSYAGSDVIVEAMESKNMVSGNVIPESFEEQMMMAMAVSLAEAQTKPSNDGISWL